MVPLKWYLLLENFNPRNTFRIFGGFYGQFVALLTTATLNMLHVLSTTQMPSDLHVNGKPIVHLVNSKFTYLSLERMTLNESDTRILLICSTN